jgi:hypothetical protein
MPTDVGNSKYGMFKFLKDRVWSKVKGWLEKNSLSGRKGCAYKAGYASYTSVFDGMFQIAEGSM